MTLYTEHDFLHAPGPDADWQESVVLLFHDPSSGFAGFFRAGSEPNLGLSQLHFSLVSRDGLRFRHHLFDLPMQTDDRTPEGFAAGPLCWRIPNRKYVRVTGSVGEVSVDLRMYDHFASTPWQLLGAGMEAIAPGHLESAGRVEGEIRIGNRRIRLDDALGYRDHSWGRRDVRVMRSFRWVAGSCGPSLAFSGVLLHLANGQFMRGGYVRRNGQLCPLSDFDVVAHVNADGVTVRGGWAEWTLADGERLRVDANVIDGVITSYRSDHGGAHSHIGVEGISEVRCGDLSGFCDFNVSNNAAGGEQPAVSICEDYATLRNGLSQRMRARA